MLSAIPGESQGCVGARPNPVGEHRQTAPTCPLDGGHRACPVSQDSIDASEELRGTADVGGYCQSGHPKMGHTGGEIKFFNGWSVFCTLHSDFGHTYLLQQGCKFTLLSRFVFIFMANVVMLLTLICRLSVFPFSHVSSLLSERAYISKIN